MVVSNSAAETPVVGKECSFVFVDKDLLSESLI